jgi:hypothetical protein
VRCGAAHRGCWCCDVVYDSRFGIVRITCECP